MTPDFTHPLWLLLPLAVLPAAIHAMWRGRGSGGQLDPLVPSRLRPALLPPGGSGHGTRTRLILRGLLLALIGMALAHPQWGQEEGTEAATARDILLAIDTSRSMLATDAPPNRLEQAKLACLDLLNRLPDDRFGVLGFAGSAFPLAPVTTDHDAIRETISALDTETLPLGGTDLAAAVEMSLEAFEDIGPRRRAMVILSDGEDLEGRLDGVAAKAREKGVFIFAFAIGTERGSVIPAPGSGGGFVLDERGQTVVTRRATATLEKLAAESGGYAAVLAGHGSLATQLQEGLAKLDAFAKKEQTRSQAAERYQWPLGLAILVLLACIWWRPGSGRAAAAVKQSAAILIGAAWIAAPPASQAATPDPSAEVAALHKEGKFQDAIAVGGRAVLDPDPDRRATASANLGISLYETGRAALPKPPGQPDPEIAAATITDWEDALAHIDHSLQLRPGHKDTTDNRRLVQEALDNLRKQLREQQDQQKQQEKEKEKENQQKQDQKQDKEKQGQQDQQQGKDPQEQEGGQPQDKQNQEGGGEQDKKSQADGAGQDPEKPEKQDSQGKDKGDKPGGKDEEKQAGDPQDNKPDREKQDGRQAKDGEMQDASSGDRKPGGREARGSVPAKIGPDGRFVLPDEPAERARVLEAIRRNLEQRSMENRKVNLIPKPNNQSAPRKDW